MNTKSRTLRRNRKFGPSPGITGLLFKETENKDTESEETENKDTESEETENKDTESEETENKDTESEETENKETEGEETVTSLSDEISELQKWGILPQDFPFSDGDIRTFDNNSGDDISEELDKLLEIGAISVTNNNNAQASGTQDKIKKKKSPHFKLSDHEIPDFDESGLPLNWTGNVDSGKVYRLVKLRRGFHEFDVIEEEFRNAHIQVKMIERLQNRRLLDRFKSEAEDLERNRSGDFRLNVSYLYHGSNVKKEALCEEGLDQRLSRMGYFGRGIYFSDNPLKCVHYSEDCKQEGPYEAYILKCRVLLGDIKIYPKGDIDTRLQREPEKETPGHGSRYYDSVLGCPKDFNEFVVYENRRAMIEYIITFQADDSVIKNLRQLSKAKTMQSSSKAGFQQEATNRDNQTTSYKSPFLSFADGTEMEPSDLSAELEQAENIVSDDHFQRISDVREAVRKKRLGKTYKPLTEDQREKDKEMWEKLQSLQLVKCEQEKLHDLAKANQHESSEPRSPLYFEEIPDCYEPRGSFRYPLYEAPDRFEDSDWLSSQHSDYSKDEDNAVEQVLSLCIAQFLSVTGIEDSSIAKHYVQKAESDVNRAISLYYEDFT